MFKRNNSVSGPRQVLLPYYPVPTMGGTKYVCPESYGYADVERCFPGELSETDFESLGRRQVKGLSRRMIEYMAAEAAASPDSSLAQARVIQPDMADRVCSFAQDVVHAIILRSPADRMVSQAEELLRQPRSSDQ